MKLIIPETSARASLGCESHGVIHPVFTKTLCVGHCGYPNLRIRMGGTEVEKCAQGYKDSLQRSEHKSRQSQDLFLSISPFMSVSICFMYLGAPILGAYMLMSVKSPSCIDPFIII